MIGKGEPWGDAASAPPDLEVSGDDASLARYVANGTPPPLLRYRPSGGADLARAVGLTASGPGRTELAVDALLVDSVRAVATPAVNAVVVGVAPDQLTRAKRSRSFEVTIDGRPAWRGRAAGVVIANGQFLRGLDVVPRGHPGDGRLEIQVYALRPGERAGMRRRLLTGTHVPHPRILERSGRVVEVATSRTEPVEVDGIARAPSREVRVAIVPAALRILV